MTTAMQDVMAVLAAAPAVTALVPAARMFPNHAPQGTKRPFVVCTVIDAIPENTFDGATRVNTHIQVDVYADGYEAAQSAGDAVELVISALSSTDLSAWLESTREDFDDIAELHRVSHDFSIWR